MKVVPTELPEVLVVDPRMHGDPRGFFYESFQATRYAEAGIQGPFVQDNLSRSVRGTLRGLHFQEPRAQGKLVQVLRGTVWDVAVDVRRGSPRFGRWVGVELSGTPPRQLWVPPRFADLRPVGWGGARRRWRTPALRSARIRARLLRALRLGGLLLQVHRAVRARVRAEHRLERPGDWHSLAHRGAAAVGEGPRRAATRGCTRLALVPGLTCASCFRTGYSLRPTQSGAGCCPGTPASS